MAPPLPSSSSSTAPVELVGASRVFNLLQQGESGRRLLVMDARSRSSYSKGHIRRATCVQLSPSGSRLEGVAGPGKPVWAKNCWWDKNVLLVVQQEAEAGLKRKFNRQAIRAETGKNDLNGGKRGRWDAEEDAEEEREAKRRRRKLEDDASEPVVAYLLKEGLVRSLQVLVSEEGVSVGVDM